MGAAKFFAEKGRDGRKGRTGRLDGVLRRIDIFPSADSFEAAVLQRRSQGPLVISFANQHALNLARDDDRFFRAIVRSDYVLRDGVGAKLALWLTGRSAGGNLNGSDLIPRLLPRFEDRRLLVLGTKAPWLDKAAARLKEMGLQVVGSLDGFQQIDTYLQAIDRHKPELVLLGMGMPRQELLADAIKKHICRDLIVINGGAILDFMAERFPRAPRPLRMLGLEWLFRLGLEPKRLARRYLVGGPRFLFAVAAVALRRVAGAAGPEAASATGQRPAERGLALARPANAVDGARGMARRVARTQRYERFAGGWTSQGRPGPADGARRKPPRGEAD